MSKVKRISIFILFLFVFAIIWSKVVDPKVVLKEFSIADWRLILLSTLLGFFFSFLGPLRLRTLLGILGGKLSLLYIWSLANIGASISVVLPFSAGGFVMPIFVSKKLKVAYRKVLGIFFIDAFFALPITIIIAPIAGMYFIKNKMVSLVFTRLDIFFYLAFLLLIIFIFLAKKTNEYKRLTGMLTKAWILVRGANKVLAKAVVITLALMMINILQSYLYFMAFGMRPAFLDFFLAGILLGLLSLMPSAMPMKIGQTETFGLITLPYLLNLDKNTVFAMLITQRMVGIIYILTMGAISFYLFKLDINIFYTIKKFKDNQ